VGCNCRKRRRGGTWIIVNPATGECLDARNGACVEYATPELATAAGNSAGYTTWGIKER